MKAIIFITASYLVLGNRGQIQGFQPPLVIPNRKYLPDNFNYRNNIYYPLGFTVPYGSSFKWNLNKYEPGLQNIDQRFYSQADGLQNIHQKQYQNKDFEVANSGTIKALGSDDQSLYILRTLLQRLKDPSKTTIIGTTVSRNGFKDQENWDFLVDQFVQAYMYQNPQDVDVFQASNELLQYKKFNSILSAFLDYIRLRLSSLLSLNPGIKAIYNYLVKLKENLNIRSFTNLVGEQKESPNQLQLLPLSQEAISDKNVPDTNANKSINAIGKPTSNIEDGHEGLDKLTKVVVPNKFVSDKLWNLYTTEKGIKVAAVKPSLWELYLNEKDNYNNIQLNPPLDKQVIVSDNLLKPKCDLGDLTQSLTNLIDKPNINEEKENLDKLFKVLKVYAVSHGDGNLPFGDVVGNIERELLNPKDNPAPRSGYGEYPHAWQIFTHEYSYGELRKLLTGVQTGREMNEEAVIRALVTIFFKLKQRLLQMRLSNETINAVIHAGLQQTLRDLIPFFVEKCKTTKLANVLHTLEVALNLRPRGADFQPIPIMDAPIKI